MIEVKVQLALVLAHDDGRIRSQCVTYSQFVDGVYVSRGNIGDDQISPEQQVVHFYVDKSRLHYLVSPNAA
ncbi:hypothetical protein D3C75_1336330 [compost metagenome]